MTHFNKLRWRVKPGMRRVIGLAVLSTGLASSGCTVIAVVDTAASAVVGAGGLVVDAAVGTARLGGKAVGAVVGSDDAE